MGTYNDKLSFIAIDKRVQTFHNNKCYCVFLISLERILYPRHFCVGLAEAVFSPSASTGDHLGDGGVHPPADHGTAGGHGGGHEGIHVFTAEFARVEIPFIISLWIFCASLAKIGTYIFKQYIGRRRFFIRKKLAN